MIRVVAIFEVFFEGRLEYNNDNNNLKAGMVLDTESVNKSII